MLQHLQKDPQLKALTEHITIKQGEKINDLYLTLLESIVSQQLSVKAADTIFKRFLALFKNQYPEPSLLITLDTETLRSVGLSYQKAGYLKNVAVFAMEKGMKMDKIDAMNDEEVIAYLTEIKGVGKWTVEMLLMFALQRPDILPLDDLGIQQAIAKLYNLEEKGKDLKKKMVEIAENWRPYRTLACKYLWRWKDLPKVD